MLKYSKAMQGFFVSTVLLRMLGTITGIISPTPCPSPARAFQGALLCSPGAGPPRRCRAEQQLGPGFGASGQSGAPSYI